MTKRKTTMEYHEESLIKQGYEEGYKKGFKESFETTFKLALKIKHRFGLQKAVDMSQFSIEELENEKMDEDKLFKRFNI